MMSMSTFNRSERSSSATTHAQIRPRHVQPSRTPHTATCPIDAAGSPRRQATATTGAVNRRYRPTAVAMIPSMDS